MPPDAAPLPPYGAPPGHWAMPRQPARLDPVSVAGFVCGVLPLVPFGLVLGVAGIVRTRRRRRRGRVVAILAVVFSLSWSALASLLVIGFVLGEADRDASGRIVEAGWLWEDDLRAGDCVKSSDFDGPTVHAVPCDRPHAVEIFAAFDVPDGPYPGRDRLVAEAERGCGERIPPAKEEGLRDRSLEVWRAFPSQLSWEDGDRTIRCLVSSDSGTLAKDYATTA